MLVIARQVNEKIIAESELTGDRLEITLVAIRNGGTQVRIGIDAPEHIRLTRAEVAQADVPADDREIVRRAVEEARAA